MSELGHDLPIVTSTWHVRSKAYSDRNAACRFKREGPGHFSVVMPLGKAAVEGTFTEHDLLAAFEIVECRGLLGFDLEDRDPHHRS
jgi:hypothetical protein